MSRDIAAIAENVFRQCCDCEGEGASVQRIVNFFKAQRDSEQWRLCNEEVDLLSDLLDPQNTCAQVDLEMLEAGLRKWVGYIEVRNCDEGVVSGTSEEIDTSAKCGFAKTATDVLRKSPTELGASLSSVSDSGHPLSCGGFKEGEVMEQNFERSTEDLRSGASRSSEWNSDVSDILSRLHQVRHENHVLVEENRKLQNQLDTTEESLNQQQVEINKWEAKNRSFQNIALENRELHSELEELRLREEALENAKKELQLQLSRGERDVQYWQSRAEEYSNMQSKLQQELDKNHSIVEEMKKSLLIYKASIEECHRQNRSQNNLLENRNKTIAKLNDAVTRLEEKSEALILEKEEREAELQKVKKEIRKLRLSWNEDRRAQSTDGETSIMRLPPLCSTPHRSESLQNELTEEMSQEMSVELPSPFCEKPVLHERMYEFSSPTSPWPVDDGVVRKLLSSSKIRDLESQFREHMDDMPGGSALKSKCITTFESVISGYQRVCKALHNEVQETREERNFLQSRYQEALQQLRDTSCLLETDIVEKMSCLEEQIKLEQLQRLEMEARIERYQEEEEERLKMKVDASTQAQSTTTLVEKSLEERSFLSMLINDESAPWSPLIRALDLAQTGFDQNCNASVRMISSGQRRHASISHSTGVLKPLLPDFDFEFSYSFDDEAYLSSIVRDRLSRGTSGLKRDLLSRCTDKRLSLQSMESKMKTRDLESPSLSSIHSWRDDGHLMEALKESDEEHDRCSSTSTASSVEDLMLEEKEKSPSPQQLEPTFDTASSAVPQEEVQRLMEANAAVSTCQLSLDNNNFHDTSPDTTNEKKIMHKVDTDDSVFEDPQLAPNSLLTSETAATAADSASALAAPVFPSLSNVKLKELDLYADDTHCKRTWTEEEAENKFTQLSLAFRTDRQTLAERINLHIAARDSSERNIKTELETIRQVANDLVQVPNFPMDVVSNLHYTCNILEQAIYRLTSRSEILGAVQQEGRLSHAVDVMVHHMDNLRVLHEKESRELDEARRILKDARFVSTTSDHGSDSLMTKRSFSTAGLQNSSPVKDPRTRFQAAAMNTAIQNSVTQHLHRLSIDRANFPDSNHFEQQQSSRNQSDTGDANGHIGVSGHSGHSHPVSEKDIHFQKGLEQGLRTQIGRELATLREEQGALTDSLDYLMDLRTLVPSEEEEAELASHRDLIDFFISKALDLLPTLHLNFSFARARWFAGGTALFLAFLILLWGVLWSVHVRHPTSPPS